MVSITNWSGWMANDDRLVGENQVIYLEDVNIHKWLSWVELAPLPSNKLTSITKDWSADYPTCNYYSKSEFGTTSNSALTEWIIGTSGGRVLSLSEWTEFFRKEELKASDQTYNPILDMRRIGDWLFVFTHLNCLHYADWDWHLEWTWTNFNFSVWIPDPDTMRWAYIDAGGTNFYTTSWNNWMVFQYTLGTADTISSINWIKFFDCSSQEPIPTSVRIKPDGTKMYVWWSNGITEYDITWGDVSTASTVVDWVLAITVDTNVEDFYIDTTWAKLIVLWSQNDSVYKYTINESWSIKTWVYTWDSFSVNAKESAPRWMDWKPDWSIMVVTGSNSDDLHEYSTTTFDVTSLSFVSTYDLATDIDASEPQLNSPSWVCFNNDGTKYLVTDSWSESAVEFSCTAYDTSTSTHTILSHSDYNLKDESWWTSGFLQSVSGYTNSWFANTKSAIVQIVTTTEPYSLSTLSWVNTWENEIVGMTLHSDNIWVYTTDWRQYAVNLTSQTEVAEKQWWENILSVHNFGAFDIVVTWVDSLTRTMYVNSWFWPWSEQILRQMVWSDVVKKFIGNQGYRFWFNSYFINDWNGNKVDMNQNYKFAKHNNTIYFVWSQWGNDVVYAYWSRTPWADPSFSIISTRDNSWTAYSNIIALWVVKDTLYISHEKDSTWHVSTINLFRGEYTGSYQPNWKIITKTEDGWDYSLTKEVKQVRIWAKIPSWTSIQIRYIVDGGSVQDYYTLDSQDLHDFEINKPIENFKEITWCLTLNSNTAQTSTPTIYTFIADIWPIQFETTSS